MPVKQRGYNVKTDCFQLSEPDLGLRQPSYSQECRFGWVPAHAVQSRPVMHRADFFKSRESEDTIPQLL